MQFHIQKRQSSQLTNSLIFLGIGLTGLIVARFGHAIFSFLPPCLFNRWTGIPCPSCGATRTAIALSHFHMKNAFLQNPLFFLLFCASILWGINTMLCVVLGKNVIITLSHFEKKLIQKLLIAAIFINWLYLILKVFHAHPAA